MTPNNLSAVLVQFKCSCVQVQYWFIVREGSCRMNTLTPRFNYLPSAISPPALLLDLKIAELFHHHTNEGFFECSRESETNLSQFRICSRHSQRKFFRVALVETKIQQHRIIKGLYKNIYDCVVREFLPERSFCVTAITFTIAAPKGSERDGLKWMMFSPSTTTAVSAAVSTIANGRNVITEVDIWQSESSPMRNSACRNVGLQKRFMLTLCFKCRFRGLSIATVSGSNN